MPVTDNGNGIPGRATEYLRDQLPRRLEVPILAVNTKTRLAHFIVHLENVCLGDTEVVIRGRTKLSI